MIGVSANAMEAIQRRNRVHATGERNLGKLGGLLRAMPWVGWIALLGALAAAGLPPPDFQQLAMRIKQMTVSD